MFEEGDSGGQGTAYSSSYVSFGRGVLGRLTLPAMTSSRERGRPMKRRADDGTGTLWTLTIDVRVSSGPENLMFYSRVASRWSNIPLDVDAFPRLGLLRQAREAPDLHPAVARALQGSETEE